MSENYLTSIRKQFEYYKSLGEKTFAQVSDDELFLQYNENSNSIAMIVQHLAGNMLSRWSDFMTADREKEWRKRDQEFEAVLKTRSEMLDKWEEGWACLFAAIDSLKPSDLEQIIYIRNQGHTVMEAFNRQLAHYPYHIGQIIFLGKIFADNSWTSLSIPRGNSETYNSGKFSKPKERRHFTDADNDSK